MKGGLAVIVYALKALAHAELLSQLDVVLIVNSDEEIGSAGSESLFLEERKNAAACLVAECAGLDGELVVSRNGKLGGRIDSFGCDRHVGDGTHEKSSAILELAHRIIVLESLNASQPGVSLNVGKIEGGLAPNTVPAKASALVDVRWREQVHKRDLLEKIHKTLDQPVQAGCRTEFTVLNSRPAMPFTRGGEDLYSLARRAGRLLGLEIGSQHRRGTSDANFFAASGVPTLDGFGPVCRFDHTAAEQIRISSLLERSKLMAHFLFEYGLDKGLIPHREGEA